MLNLRDRGGLFSLDALARRLRALSLFADLPASAAMSLLDGVVGVRQGRHEVCSTASTAWEVCSARDGATCGALLSLRPCVPHPVRVCAGSPACRWCHFFALRGRGSAARRQASSTQDIRPQASCGRCAPLFLQQRSTTSFSPLLATAYRLSTRLRTSISCANCYAPKSLRRQGQVGVRRERMPR